MNASINTAQVEVGLKAVKTPTRATLRAFADQYRLKTSLDECRELIIPGRQGQIYEYSDTQLGVMFSPNDSHPRRWSYLRRRAIAAGLRVVQDGDSEGAFVFDPNDPEQVALALKIAKVIRRRQISEARRNQLRGYLTKAHRRRSDPPEESTLVV